MTRFLYNKLNISLRLYERCVINNNQTTGTTKEFLSLLIVCKNFPITQFTLTLFFVKNIYNVKKDPTTCWLLIPVTCLI